MAIVKLAEVCEKIGSGATPRGGKEAYCDEGISLVRSQNVLDFNFSKEGLAFINDEQAKKLSNVEVHSGDVLLNITGDSVARACLMDDDYLPARVNQHVAIIRGNSHKIMNGYVLYYLQWRKEYLLQLASAGATRNALTKAMIEQLELDLPPLDSQQQIVAILDSLQSKIQLNQKTNDNLQQQAQAIYHERFETVSPNDLPSNWRIVTLGEVAAISNKSFNPLKEPEILLEHYSIPAFDEAKFPVFELSTSIKSNKFIIDALCFMISKLNPTTKRVWKPYCLTGNAVCSTEFIVYKAKDKSITNFLYSVIDSSSFSDFMCSHVTGSTGSRQRTTPSDTLSYELILPSEDELEEFQSLVSPMYAQIRINAIENDKLKRLRDSLLPKLMSGEIDVSAVQL
jgi:type I restriction enzyme, S subunit